MTIESTTENKNANFSVLGFDLGKHTGWCFLDRINESNGLILFDNFAQFYSSAMELIDLWKPSAIVIGKPNLFAKNSYNVFSFHTKLLGILCLIAEKKGLVLFELNDSSSRKIVFGKGMKKKEAHALMPDFTDPDIADATILARAQYQLLLNA